MAKLGSFFRRLFISFTSDDDDYSPPPPVPPPSSSSSISPSRKHIIILPPLTPRLESKTIISQMNPITSRSCSSSPRLSYRPITKQTTIQIDNTNRENSTVNFLSSQKTKSTNRRLSAPLIIHVSTRHHRQYRSAIVDESLEEALIFPLQRLSLSSTTGTSVHHNNSVNSLGTSVGGSPSASPRNDAHSQSLNLSSSNSFNLPSSLNNISPASGMCKTIFVFRNPICLSLYNRALFFLVN